MREGEERGWGWRKEGKILCGSSSTARLNAQRMSMLCVLCYGWLGADSD